jgi:lipopolysaccharide biosynthesis protein
MKLKHVTSRLRSKVFKIKYNSLKHELNSLEISKHYKQVVGGINNLSRSKKIVTAVVVHLYYTESWDAISEKLKSISSFSFDIFVSLPKQNMDFKQSILLVFPHAFVYEAPNRGRDVLPFVSVAGVLYDKGYRHVLKLHSKKSIHRKDGEDWMVKMLNALVPKQPKLQSLIIDTLKRPEAAMIGPKGQYVSLRVNFDANGTHMTEILTKLYTKKVAYDALQVHRSEYGFFAGTMFWVNLESINPLLEKFSKARFFESESGQIDATFAHSLERLFCVMPEILNQDIYEVGSDAIKQISYNDGVIPDWSNVYIGPKPKI